MIQSVSRNKSSFVLVISDLHLSSGRFTADGGINPYENFFQDAALVELLKYYSTGSFANKPVELVVNGDFFELVDTYLDDVDPLRTYAEDEIRKLKLIFAGHRRVFAALRQFARSKEHQITFITGNHDQGLLFPEVREFISTRLGRGIRFRDFEYRVDDVLIQHGNQLEGRFGAVREPYFIRDDQGRRYLNYTEGTEFHIRNVVGAKKKFHLIQRVRPYKDFVRWLWVFQPFTFLRLISHVSITMMGMLLPLKRLAANLRKMGRLVNWLKGGDLDELLLAHPEILTSARVHVCGHSHYYKFRAIADDRMYVNTGTWTPVINLDLASLGKEGQLPFCVIELRGGRRRRVSLKTWRGFLGPAQDLF